MRQPQPLLSRDPQNRAVAEYFSQALPVTLAAQNNWREHIDF